MAKALQNQHFPIESAMKPYVGRLRLRLSNIDCSGSETKGRLETNQSEMMKILKKKKVPQEKAEWAIAETLDIAVNHQLDPARREQYFANCAIAKKHLRQLRICQLRRHVRIRSHETYWRPDRLGAICLLKLLEAHLGRQKMQLKKAFQSQGKAE